MPGMSGNLSSPKPGHTTGGSGVGAQRVGGVGHGGAEWDADRYVHQRDKHHAHPPDAGRKTPWVCLWKHEQRKTLFKPMGEQNQRLTHGLSVGQRPLFVPGC